MTTGCLTEYLKDMCTIHAPLIGAVILELSIPKSKHSTQTENISTTNHLIKAQAMEQHKSFEAQHTCSTYNYPIANTSGYDRLRKKCLKEDNVN